MAENSKQVNAEEKIEGAGKSLTAKEDRSEKTYANMINFDRLKKYDPSNVQEKNILLNT